jgi:uncharacterized membrane protein (UPF0182 family)
MMIIRTASLALSCMVAFAGVLASSAVEGADVDLARVQGVQEMVLSVADIDETSPVEEESVQADTEETAEDTAPTAPVLDPNLQSLIDSANAHFLAAEEAQREGNWAAYGRELEALQQDLEELLKLAGEE